MFVIPCATYEEKKAPYRMPRLSVRAALIYHNQAHASIVYQKQLEFLK